LQRMFIILSLGCLTLAGSLWAEEGNAEFASGPAGVATPVSDFDSTDRDANGMISVEEFRNRMTKVFFELDSDGDGILQEDEFSAVLIAPQHELADSDGDKAISHREFMGHTILLFESVDSDEDGHFTKEELAAAGHGKENRRNARS
jgi:Ca2+-binding EF-hand superfamily protein